MDVGMSGAIILHPLYTFMAYRVDNITLPK
jgi:hypothetical protein